MKDPSGAWVVVAEYLSVTSYTASSLATGTTYFLRVAANDALGKDYSNVFSWLAAGAPFLFFLFYKQILIPIPGPPSTLDSFPVFGEVTLQPNSCSLSISWNPPNKTYGAAVDYYVLVISSNITSNNITTTSTSYQLTGLPSFLWFVPVSHTSS